MCARFTLRLSSQAIKDLFELDEAPEMPPRFNIAPTQDIAAITQSREGDRKLRMLRWGLIPYWAKDPAIGTQMINARDDTLAVKPAFKLSFERRRCLIPSDGFYEWAEMPPPVTQNSLFDLPGTVLNPQASASRDHVTKHKAQDPVIRAPKPKRQPYHITMKDGSPFSFAGLWDRWSDPDGRIIDSCTIITTSPNEVVAPLHDRMPVILPPDDYAEWLDRHEKDVRLLSRLLKPFPGDVMKATAVNPAMGNPRLDSPECLAAAWS